MTDYLRWITRNESTLQRFDMRMVIPYFMRKHEVFNFLASVHLFVHILFADYCYSSVENASSLKYYGLFSIVAGGNCMDVWSKTWKLYYNIACYIKSQIMKNRNMESNLSCTFAERQTDQEVSCISVSLHSFDVSSLRIFMIRFRIKATHFCLYTVYDKC